MASRAMKRFLLGLIVLMVLTALVGRVSIAASNAGRTSADFLQIGAGADAAGMSGAYSSVAQGAAATFWNPARLATGAVSEISFSHFMWYQGIKIEHGAASFMIGPRTAIGASVTFLDYGSIDGFDLNGNSTGQVSAYDMQGGISLSFGLSDNLFFGVTGKYISEKLADINASTFAGDLGLSYRTGRWSVSAVASNLGSGMKYETTTEKLPSAVRLAVAGAPFGSMLLASTEVEKRLYGDIVIRNGLELTFNDQYFLRGGLNYYPQAEQRTLGTGFSLGAGIRFGRTGFDYAFTPKDSYTSEDVHRFSLLFSLGH